VELGLDGRVGPVEVSAHYTYLQATFRTPLILNSSNNSMATPLSCPACTQIRVRPGDRIPAFRGTSRNYGSSISAAITPLAWTPWRSPTSSPAVMREWSSGSDARSKILRSEKPPRGVTYASADISRALTPRSVPAAMPMMSPSEDS
jgi:hypothetical protein